MWKILANKPAAETSAVGRMVVRAEGINAARFVLPSGGRLDDRRATRDLVAVVVRGSGTFSVQTKMRAVSSGDVLDFVSGQLHSINADGELEIVVLDSPSLLEALSATEPR